MYYFIAFPYNAIWISFEAGGIIWIDAKSGAVLDHTYPCS